MSPVLVLAITLMSFAFTAWPTSVETIRRQNETQSPTTTAFCDLVKAPERYDKLLVRTKAILLEGPEHSMLYDPGCLDARNLTWFEWEGYARALKTAEKNVQEKMSKYIKSDDRAMVTVIGTFQAKPDVEVPKEREPGSGWCNQTQQRKSRICASRMLRSPANTGRNRKVASASPAARHPEGEEEV